MRKANKRYYYRNKEKILLQKKEYYKKNKEKIKGERMSYYNDKIRCFHLIDSMYQNGKKPEVIIYKVGLEFGFSEKIVLDRINILKAMVDDQ